NLPRLRKQGQKLPRLDRVAERTEQPKRLELAFEKLESGPPGSQDPQRARRVPRNLSQQLQPATIRQLLTDDRQLELPRQQQLVAALMSRRRLDTERLRERASNRLQQPGIPICNEHPHSHGLCTRQHG